MPSIQANFPAKQHADKHAVRGEARCGDRVPSRWIYI